MARNILILGATSSIARALAEKFAAHGDNLFLASRDAEELAKIGTDLIIRYQQKVYWKKFNAQEFSTHELFWQEVLQTMQTIDGVVLAFGTLGEATQIGYFPNDHQVITDNFTGAVSILSYGANYFTTQRKGFIIGLSSVAGDRGRQSNYLYGAAKSALTVYLQGLRNRLFPFGIRVITIKLGLVDTAMTFGRPNLFWVAKPSKVANKIMAVLNSSRDVVYLPWFWRYIMAFIKTIPETFFKRLKL